MSGDVRDRAQADNLEWIVEREGAAGKVLIFGHRYHLSATAVSANWIGAGRREVMGCYLRRRFGARLLTVGNLIGRGVVDCAGARCGDGVTHCLALAPADSLEELAGELDEPRYLLDLRAAPARVSRYLQEVHPFGRGTPGQGRDTLDMPVREAFDVLFYLDAVTPTCCPRNQPAPSVAAGTRRAS